MKVRMRAGKTQREVALALGVTDKTISNWETGGRTFRLTPQQMLALTRFLDCTLEELAEEQCE
jgi:transcriptional regulator with XRE-family HTH domain